jgi:hypothetical protein
MFALGPFALARRNCHILMAASTQDRRRRQAAVPGSKLDTEERHMRITGLALGLVALVATACLAETPDLSGGRPAGLFSSSSGRTHGGQNWWTRFGEPVNAAALADQKAEVVPAGMYNGDYIYGPGTCDCPPPCINQLWTGYYQHPKRCNPYVPLCQRLCGGHCGNGDCNGGCGGGCRLFGHGKGCGCGDGLSCSTKAACGCTAPVTCTTAPDCGCAKPLCGCKHAHLGHKWKNFMAHWSRDCDSCSAPLGCGCATPVAPQMQIPSEKQALTRPLPIPEDAALIALPRIN